MASLSRSAFSPALPTGDNPAPICVLAGDGGFDERQLAIDRAIFFAAFAVSAPVTSTPTNLRALAVPDDLMSRVVCRHMSSPVSERRQPAIRCCRDLRRAAPPPGAPVANSISVSDVEVSLSTVIALNEPCTDFDNMACRAGAATGASVKRKTASSPCRARSCRPLAMPEMRTGTPPDRPRRFATLGNVSVVMIARAASSQRSPSPRRKLADDSVELPGVERFADHAGRGHEDFAFSFPPSPQRRFFADSLTASAPTFQ